MSVSPALRFAAPLITGGLLLLAYPPFDMDWLAWIALVPLLWVWKRSPRGRLPWLSTGAAGLVWGGGVFYPLLFVEGGTWLERVGGFVAVTLAIIVFLLLFSYLFRFVTSRYPISFWRSSLMASVLWISLEYVWRAVAVGFSPYLGITQWQQPALLYVASFGGVHAVSALLLIVNGGISHLVDRFAIADWDSHRMLQSGRAGGVACLAFAGLMGILLGANGFFTAFSIPEQFEADSVAAAAESAEEQWVALLVQPGFTPGDYAQAAAQGWAGHERMFTDALNLTRMALNGYDGSHPVVVFWPETTVHIDTLTSTRLAATVSELAQEFGAGLVLGIPRFIDDPMDAASGGLFGIRPAEYNSARIVTPMGTHTDIYDKVYVIPIAEAQYAPGRDIKAFYPLAGERDEGPPVGIGICSDVVEPTHARQAIMTGAGSLHYISALSRIGALVQLEQAFLSMRAAEHRVYVTQTATTGPTVVVDPSGRVESRLETSGPGVHWATLPSRTEPPTLYTLWGDWPVALAAFIFAAVGLAGLVSRRGFQLTEPPMVKFAADTGGARSRRLRQR